MDVIDFDTVISEALEKEAKKNEQYKTTEVEKHLELEFDLGNLLAIDINDLDFKSLRENKEDYLLSLARDNTQLLLNKLWDLPTEQVEEVIVAKLPAVTTVLPREKPCPKSKPLTKWQKYALEKGIANKKKTNVLWDNILQKWVPRFGFKKADAEKQKSWLIEVPDGADPYEDQFAKLTKAKTEKVAKNEFQRLRNMAASKKIKIPKEGLPPVERPNASQLKQAASLARVSTASLGHFQAQLPKEKASKNKNPLAKKVKRSHVMSVGTETASQLAIVHGLLGKKPRLDMEKAVSREINAEQEERSEEKKAHKSKSKGGKKRRSSMPLKARKGAGRPSGKGRIGKVSARKGKGGGGRKRR